MFRFLTENFRWIAGGALLTFTSSFGQSFFIGQSGGYWQDKFALSAGEFGGLYMLATLASAVCLPFVGKLVDVFSEPKTVIASGLVLAFALVLVALAPHVAVLGGALFLLRLMGQGMMTHIPFTATGRWFAANRGRAVSLVTLGLQGGQAVLPMGFAVIVAAAGHRFGHEFGHPMGWLAGAGFVLLVALPLGAWAYAVPRTPKGQAVGHDETIRHWRRLDVLGDPWFWVLLTGVLAPPFIGTVIVLYQDHVEALRGWPGDAFAKAIAMKAVLTLVMTLVAGALIDRFSARALLPVFVIPLAGACFVLGAVDALWGLYAAMALLAIAYGFSATLFGALWPEIYGTKYLGEVRSIIVAAMVVATAVGPGITGYLIDRGITLPVQLGPYGLYCLGVCGLLVLASRVLRRRGTG